MTSFLWPSMPAKMLQGSGFEGYHIYIYIRMCAYLLIIFLSISIPISIHLFFHIAIYLYKYLYIYVSLYIYKNACVCIPWRVRQSSSWQVAYPESLTDPSYAGQILVITYPLVGVEPPRGWFLRPSDPPDSTGSLSIRGWFGTRTRQIQMDLGHWSIWTI